MVHAAVGGDDLKPKVTHDENAAIPGEVAPFVYNEQLEKRYVHIILARWI
jgi:hypothetical protein